MLGRSWFGHRSRSRRLVAVSALLAGSAGVLAVVGRVVGFPADFNGAQSQSAAWLAKHPDRWLIWQRTATRDLAVFVPAYVAYGAAALAWAVPDRARRRWACSLVVAAGAADVVETLLFRGTLGRFLAGAPASDLAARASLTRAATGAKVIAGLGAIVVLLAVALRRSSTEA